jgi:hypothetical protein
MDLQLFGKVVVVVVEVVVVVVEVDVVGSTVATQE